MGICVGVHRRKHDSLLVDASRAGIPAGGGCMASDFQGYLLRGSLPRAWPSSGYTSRASLQLASVGLRATRPSKWHPLPAFRSPGGSSNQRCYTGSLSGAIQVWPRPRGLSNLESALGLFCAMSATCMLGESSCGLQTTSMQACSTLTSHTATTLQAKTLTL